MFRTEVLDRWQDVQPLREVWNRLAALSETHEIFSTFEFAEGWMLSKTRHAKLHVVVVRDGTEVVAIAPLMRATRRVCGIPLTSLEFIGTPHSDYSEFLARDDSALKELWRAVCDQTGGAGLFYLQQMKESSPSYRVLNADPHLSLRPCTIGLSAKLPEAPNAPIEAYLKGPGLRKRTLRRIEKEGAVDLLTFDRAEDVKAYLPVLFDQHIRRWAETSTPSFFLKEANRNLYANWADHLGSRVMLSILTLNSKPVATVYGFAYNRKLIVHTVTFDPDYKQFHCGLVCIVRVMQDLRRRGIEYVDFTRGTEGFKTFFADIRTLSYECVRAQSLAARCLMAVFLAAKDLAIAHNHVRRVAAAFGFRAAGVDPAALKPAQPASTIPEPCPDANKSLVEE